MKIDLNKEERNYLMCLLFEEVVRNLDDLTNSESPDLKNTLEELKTILDIYSKLLEDEKTNQDRG